MAICIENKANLFLSSLHIIIIIKIILFDVADVFSLLTYLIIDNVCDTSLLFTCVDGSIFFDNTQI